jgi:hypothetical protein
MGPKWKLLSGCKTQRQQPPPSQLILQKYKTFFFAQGPSFPDASTLTTMTLNITTFSTVTFSITVFGEASFKAMTFSITAFGEMTFSIMTFS